MEPGSRGTPKEVTLVGIYGKPNGEISETFPNIAMNIHRWIDINGWIMLDFLAFTTPKALIEDLV